MNVKQRVNSLLSESLNSTEDGQNSNSKNTELIKKLEIKGTPFHIVFAEGNKGFLAMGIYRMTEDLFDNKVEALNYIVENKWNLIVQMIIVCIKSTKAIEDEK
nr:MAG: hypothetical protein [Microviridae sp.]